MSETEGTFGAPAKAVKAEKTKRATYVIVIDEVEGMPNYETVSVNGKTWQIKRGEEVEVPYEVLHVLENAKATKYVKETSSDGKVSYVEREYGTIPFRVLR